MILRKYVREDNGIAAIEASLLFPVMILMLLGMLDLGYGILAAQKTIRASQVIADLVARKPSVSTNDINEAIEAGRLALQPFDTASLGVDIVSIYYDENDIATVCWRETVNMSPNATVVGSTNGLGETGDGILAVTVQYEYIPSFYGKLFSELNLQEIAFVRGRKAPVVEIDGGCL